jgi:hypothetical protein
MMELIRKINPVFVQREAAIGRKDALRAAILLGFLRHGQESLNNVK